MFEEKVLEAEKLVPQVVEAEQALIEAKLYMKEAMVWFWRFREKDRKRVEERRPYYDVARQEVEILRKKRDKILREAKGALGLWSQVGIDESRALLWENFNIGKEFAKRRSIVDAFFEILQSRDKDWFIIVIRIVCSAIFHYTIGTILSVFSFALSLPSVLSSFAPSWPSAIFFYSVAVVGAISVVVAYILLLFAAGTAVVATTASVVAHQQYRLEGDGVRPTLMYTRRRRRRMF